MTKVPFNGKIYKTTKTEGEVSIGIFTDSNEKIIRVITSDEEFLDRLANATHVQGLGRMLEQTILGMTVSYIAAEVEDIALS